MTRTSTAVLCLGLITVVTPLLAHHGSSWFDKSKPATITGIVTQVDWVNPHAYLYIDVKGENGQMENWAIECFSSETLVRNGLKYVPKGTAVSIAVYRPLPGPQLAAKIQPVLAKERLKANRYVAGGCVTTSSIHQQLGYGPPCT